MRVSVGDIRLFFEVYGQERTFENGTFERKPVLIGLHGGPGLDGTKLRYQLAPLADVAQVVVPDQRGHGRSDRASSETWNTATWAADVKKLSDALDIERPVVLGFSFGGGIAQRYAATYPDHPSGLILVSTTARWLDPDETIERFREVGGDAAAEAHRRDLANPTEETAAEWGRICFPLLSRRTDADPLLERIEAWRFENQSHDINVHHLTEARTTDLRPLLRSVRCPTLVLIGEHDPLIPPQYANEIVDAIPNGLARLHLIPDASHDVLADNPREGYARIREFLGDVDLVH
jgi:pimeloyl-ACP methyl ester carboxylesterase